MKITKKWIPAWIDWDEFAFATMLAANDEASAIEICRYELHGYALRQQPKTKNLNFRLEQARAKCDALHQFLYDRPVPIDAPSMLVHAIKAYITLTLALFMAGLSLVGNVISFGAFGWGMAAALVAAIFLTALPIAIGHLAYEKLLARTSMLQIVLLVVITLLGCAGFYEYGQSRRMAVRHATTKSATNSYVDDNSGSESPDSSPSDDSAEANANDALGSAAFLFAAAAELALVYLFGSFVTRWSDKTYVAWRELKVQIQELARLEEQFSELLANLDEAKIQCMTGLRRAQDIRNKRRTPYHKGLAILVLCTLFECVVPSYSQTVDHEEGVLIDTSASMATGPANQDLFRECVASAEKLLGSEMPKTRVWVSIIASDSFGGVREILTGWTPDVHGVFDDDLNRARHQLKTHFEMKSASLSATASGTDIFGGLWRLRTYFDATPRTSKAATKTVWIFSDMMNETEEFPMPKLVEIGPERMLERAKANGLVSPLPGYEIHIYGASTSGLTTRSWATIRRFWEIYFAAADAKLVSYSTGCDAERQGN